ncbi:MAG: SAM-dependent methyltransferase, partial [Armatimonadetes bacterium]|nr:SAM-dependent methyltransferase [Armatimonadota bacterium]
SFNSSLQQYLIKGEAQGLHDKRLIRTRNPWYRMETRDIPPILFAYHGRRNTRFIRNYAGVVPLTCFLCVYPRNSDPHFVEGLWKVLPCPQTIANLRQVGKSYGGDASKSHHEH